MSDSRSSSQDGSSNNNNNNNKATMSSNEDDDDDDDCGTDEDRPPSTADYRIGPMIGQGSFAQVHYARHKRSNRDVAIKVIDQVTARKHPHLIQSLFQERDLLSQTLPSMDSVIRLWSSFYDSQCLYMVLEFCGGGDLQQWMESSWGGTTPTNTTTDATTTAATKVVEQDQAATDSSPQATPRQSSPRPPQEYFQTIPLLLRQLWRALNELHSKYQIVHCDIKPANILLTMEGQVKLADFGSALDLSSSSSSSAALTLLPRGTAEYASPELLSFQHAEAAATAAPRSSHESHEHQNPGGISFAVDYWSFGCVAIALYRNGTSPFAARDPRLRSEALVIQSILDHANHPDQTLAAERLLERLNDEDTATMAGVDNVKAQTIETTTMRPSSLSALSDTGSNHKNDSNIDQCEPFLGLLHARPSARSNAWQYLNLFANGEVSSGAERPQHEGPSSSSSSTSLPTHPTLAATNRNNLSSSQSPLSSSSSLSLLYMPPPPWKATVEEACVVSSPHPLQDGAKGWSVFFV